MNDAQTATAQNSQAAEKCPDPNNLQAASQNTGKKNFLYGTIEFANHVFICCILYTLLL